MEKAIGTAPGAVDICVPLALARGKRLIQKPPPGLAFQIVYIVNLITIAAGTIAICKNKLIVSAAQEAGVGAFLLFITYHTADPLEAINVIRLCGAEINQRITVHITTEMDVATVVNGHSYIIVAVPPDGFREVDKMPISVINGAYRNRHAPLGIIEGDILVRRLSE